MPERLKKPPRAAPFPFRNLRAKEVFVEILLWGLALALVSPLILYARSSVLPLPALFAIAGGIALALALAGRQLADLLLADALSRRNSLARFLLGAGLMVVFLMVVLVGLIVAFLQTEDGRERTLPIP